MAERYTQRIEAYCHAAGIVVPAGFYRHPAGRYAVIDVACDPHQLIAKTWSKQEDLCYYLSKQESSRRFKLLDFKERQELSLVGPKSLARGAGFQ